MHPLPILILPLLLPLASTIPLAQPPTNTLSDFQRSISVGLEIALQYSPSRAQLHQISGNLPHPLKESSSPQDFQHLTLFMTATEDTHSAFKYLVQSTSWTQWNPNVFHGRSFIAPADPIDWSKVSLSLEEADAFLKAAGVRGKYQEFFVFEREIVRHDMERQVYYGFRFLQGERRAEDRGVAFVGNDDHRVFWVPFEEGVREEEGWFGGLLLGNGTEGGAGEGRDGGGLVNVF